MTLMFTYVFGGALAGSTGEYLQQLIPGILVLTVAIMVSQLVSFPLLFISNVFVDPATMPALLQRFMTISPVSLTVTAVRGLNHGSVTTTQLAAMLLSCAILIVIFAPLTMHLYNNKNTG